MSPMVMASIALIAALGPSKADTQVTVRSAAMIASCRFRDGQSAHLIVPIGSPQIFVSIRNRAGTNDLSSIEYGQSGDASVETNGGISKIQFVLKLTQKLMRGPFQVATRASLRPILARRPTRDCDLPFQLSPK